MAGRKAGWLVQRVQRDNLTGIQDWSGADNDQVALIAKAGQVYVIVEGRERGPGNRQAVRQTEHKQMSRNCTS